METFLVQLTLGLLLFFIINWIGKHSYSLGYISLSIFIRIDEAPAFNFIIRVLSPIVYLFITAAILYSLNLDKYVNNFYYVSVYYLTIRLFINTITGRSLLINWRRQFIYWLSIITISYFAYKKIIITKTNLLPDFNNLANELWIIICLFIYQIFNKIEISNETTIRRKNKYLEKMYYKINSEYGDIIDTVQNRKLIAIIYAIIIYENFNRPYIIRILEYCLFFLSGKPKTLGIMQVYTEVYINDKQSVLIGIKKITQDYNKLISTKNDRYDPKNGWLEQALISDLLYEYNKGYDYAESVNELLAIIEEKFFSNNTDKLSDGIK